MHMSGESINQATANQDFSLALKCIIMIKDNINKLMTLAIGILISKNWAVYIMI